MRKVIFIAFILLVIFSQSCQKDPILSEVASIDLSLKKDITPLDGREPLSRTQIDRVALQHLLAINEFKWNMVDDYTVWSAIVNSDSVVSIGFQPEGFQDLNNKIHEINANEGEWKAVRDALLAYIVSEENAAHPDTEVTQEDLLAFGLKRLPYINMKLDRYETIAKLRNLNVVRYVEPMGYGREDAEVTRSGSGCGSSAVSNMPTTEYTTISPGAKVSWHYYESNIPAAWSHSTGDNIGIGLIDTGIGPNQPKLNGQFSSGYSTGRYRSKYGKFVTGWWWWASIDGPDDDCGHGTSMAGTLAAPRTSSGSITGVAYKANLVSVRGTDDVVINESREKDGVSDAYVLLGNRSDIKIISMSLGDVFYSSQVADAVRYAYNRGKLIFAAAGTSLSWTSWWGVIFPATMSETVAVTGVKTGTSLNRCTICHDGSQVDFVVTMEDKNNSNRTAISMHTSGNAPNYTGGSSIATATTAGAAALIWARKPSMSRSTVLQHLKNASEFYPSRNGNFGYGRFDALQAVLGVN